jgi:hypothetical protein
VTKPAPDRLIIEPLDPAKHDRAAFSCGVFSCGVETVDNFFRLTANKLAAAGNIRVFVMTTPEGGVIGFHAVNAHAVDYGDLPANDAKVRPRHGTIPAAYISMIGVGTRHSGHGCGGDLLADALARIAAAADSIGIAIVMLDILDDGDARLIARREALYESYGFQSLPSNPLRLFLPLATVRQLLASKSN